MVKPNYPVVAVGTLLLVVTCGLGLKADDTPGPLDSLYRRAQRDYSRQNYESALPLLRDYVERSKSLRFKRERLLWVVDQIGRIYLREMHDPDSAIAFFEQLSKHKKFNDAEYEVIDEWLSAAREWKQLGDMPDEAASADTLLERGKHFYQKGLAVQKFPGDDAGDAYFHIAASYLVPFIVNFDYDPRIGEALLMMGVVRHNSWTDAEYWSNNFYLHEVIRRFPHTALAQKAYEMLDMDIHFGYTGSSGDSTPASLLRLLEQYKRLAQPEPAVKTEQKPDQD